MSLGGVIQRIRLLIQAQGGGQAAGILGRLAAIIGSMPAQIAAVGAATAKVTFELGQMGARVRDVENAFRAAGGTTEAFNKAMEGLRGTVSDDFLRRQFNLANTLGISAEQFAQLTKVASAAAAALGKDVPDALNDVVVAVSRQSKLILDNIGITLDVGEANERYARSIGKTVEQLTEAEKQQAFFNEVMRRAKPLLDRAPDESHAAKYQRISAAIQNAKDSLVSFVDVLLENSRLLQTDARNLESDIGSLIRAGRSAAEAARFLAASHSDVTREQRRAIAKSLGILEEFNQEVRDRVFDPETKQALEAWDSAISTVERGFANMAKSIGDAIERQRRFQEEIKKTLASDEFLVFAGALGGIVSPALGGQLLEAARAARGEAIERPKAKERTASGRRSMLPEFLPPITPRPEDGGLSAGLGFDSLAFEPVGGPGILDILGGVSEAAGEATAKAVDATTQAVDTLAQSLNEARMQAEVFEQVMTSAAGAMGAGFGNAIVGALLFGKSFGEAMKQAIASAAQFNLVKAIENTALGLAALAFGNAAQAGLFFAAAKAHGLVGGIAAAIGAGTGAFSGGGAGGRGGAGAGPGGQLPRRSDFDTRGRDEGPREVVFNLNFAGRPLATEKDIGAAVRRALQATANVRGVAPLPAR